MTSSLLPDPTLLFRFKINVYRMPLVKNLEDLTAWRLVDEHRIPPLGQFNSGCLPIQARIGWNPQGLFFAFSLGLWSHYTQRTPIPFQANMSVNSRYDSSVLRENEFCSGFHFHIEKREVGNAIENGVQSELEVLRVMSRVGGNKPMPVDESRKESLRGWIRTTAKELSAWIHIGASEIPGYRPEEFPDIGLNYDLAAFDPATYGSVFHWHLVHSFAGNSRSNPSLWTQCRLV
jgi:hypothetical protein